jgi:hypothetical protein
MVRVIQVYWATMLFRTLGLRSCILKIHVRLGVSRAYISYGYENWVCTPTEIQSHDQNFILPAQEFWPSGPEIRSKSSPGCGTVTNQELVQPYKVLPWDQSVALLRFGLRMAVGGGEENDQFFRKVKLLVVRLELPPRKKAKFRIPYISDCTLLRTDLAAESPGGNLLKLRASPPLFRHCRRTTFPVKIWSELMSTAVTNSSPFCPAPNSVQFFDCNLLWLCPCLPLQADPDIGGVGVDNLCWFCSPFVTGFDRVCNLLLDNDFAFDFWDDCRPIEGR